MTPPQPKSADESYRPALQEALQAYCRRDPAEAAEAAGAVFDPAGLSVELALIGTRYRILDKGERILRPDASAEAPAAVKILLLHYLASATGAPLTGRSVAFRELPGGAFYSTTFQAHTVTVLLQAFGNDDVAFRSACMALGAVEKEGSGTPMRFQALPRVPVTLSYWPGEEEMPPGAQILFDASVRAYLPLEDVAVLGETLAHRVVEQGGRGGSVALYEYGDGR